jgi:hypothetical protein
MVKNMGVNLLDLMNPKGGRGMTETILAILLVLGLLYLNLKGIEVNKTIEGLGYMLFGYLWGDRPNKKNKKEDEQNEIE